jgi:hypothetical protein
MKSHAKFIIAILLMLAVVLVIEYRMPRHFIWQPTFSHVDKQPFGCMVFDSVMKASMPHGYTIEKRSLGQMLGDTTVFFSPRHYPDSVVTRPVSILIITTENSLTPSDRDIILHLASQGNTIMVASLNSYLWDDTLGIETHWNEMFRLEQVAGVAVKNGTVKWCQDSAYAGHPLSMKVYSAMVERTITPSDSIPHRVLMTYADTSNSKHATEALAVSYPIGMGELILVSSPLLLTNYMTVSGRGSLLQARLMNRLSKNPVIRTEAYMSVTAQDESSPFYVLLREPPLRWALYLSLLSILLFCIFTARRRQRAIPVVTKPQNRNLEFVRHIGTLYWQEHWNPGLLAKKLAYTEDEIRRQNARLSPDDLYFLNQVREAASGNHLVSDEELRIYVKELNRIQQSL